MPAKNSVKLYAKNSYYHIYNRGVEKRLIFLDNQDYGVFLSYLKEYLLPKDEKNLREKLLNPLTSYKEKDHILKTLKLKNFYNEIKLLAYCLMPNHFHFLVKQSNADSIDHFMNSLCVRYVMYFNRKYKRVGVLYQDVYKAVLVESDEQLLHLTRYIHCNPLNKKSKPLISASQVDGVQGYFSKPSSLPEYLEQRKTKWVYPEDILAHFSKTNPKLSYQAFIEESNDLTIIQSCLLDI